MHFNFNPRSHEGSDIFGIFPKSRFGISIHAPTRGATLDSNHLFRESRISIHAPTRGATVMFVATIQPLKFQSTLPRGERRHEVQQQTQVRDFNPRSHEGSDCGKGLQRSTTLLFQSTLPRGERLPIPQRQSERILFQSTLPRGERRSRSVYSLCHYAISIHAPTRGATMPT